MSHGFLVEDEIIGQGRKQEIHNGTEGPEEQDQYRVKYTVPQNSPCYEEKAKGLSIDVVSAPLAHPRILRWFYLKVSGSWSNGFWDRSRDGTIDK